MIYTTVTLVSLTGALNGILSLVERGEEPRQIVTHSSGNHGQAVAWAAATANLPCTIVVPAGTPSVKVRTAEHGHCQSHNPPGNKNNNHKTES